jgi:hypothetical protein
MPNLSAGIFLPQYENWALPGAGVGGQNGKSPAALAGLSLASKVVAYFTIM